MPLDEEIRVAGPGWQKERKGGGLYWIFHAQCALHTSQPLCNTEISNHETWDDFLDPDKDFSSLCTLYCDLMSLS